MYISSEVILRTLDKDSIRSNTSTRSSEVFVDANEDLINWTSSVSIWIVRSSSGCNSVIMLVYKLSRYAVSSFNDLSHLYADSRIRVVSDLGF